jgi:hypothetical protein
MAEDVRAECKRRYGETPCVQIIGLDGTLREAHDCVGWCPLLNRVIEELNEGGVDGGHSR